MGTIPIQPLQTEVSIIIPARNEASRIEQTLQAVREAVSVKDQRRFEIIVVDDGSSDGTIQAARPYVDRLVCHSRNLGKGTALHNGWQAAKGRYIVFLDADLGSSAGGFRLLLDPVEDGKLDMAIAELPPARVNGGFGLVKGLAVQGIYRLCGYPARAPLSGQRAIRREVLERIGGLSRGFGIEVGLTIDAVRAGFRIAEIPVPFHHRDTGRDWHGFYHRGKQFVSVGRTLLYKWRHPLC